MSTDLTAIDERIAELQKMREALVDAEKQEAILAAKSFKWEYDYSVEWTHPAQVRIERKLSADCELALENFRNQFPSHYMKPFVGGMTYSVLEGGYMLGGGGAIIVNFDQSKFYSPDPAPILPEHLVELRNGIVPLAIRKP